MSTERDLQGIFRKVYNDTTESLTVDIGMASVTLDAGDLRIGGVEIQDETTGDRVAVTPAGELTATDPQVLAELILQKALLTTIDSALTAIKDTDGIKKITDALPAGANLLGKIQLSDGTLDVPIINNGSNNAIPVVTDARQEQVEIFDSSIDIIGGVQSVSFSTGTEGYYSSRLLIESSAATTVDIYYSAGIDFPITAFDSVAVGAGSFEIAGLDVPGWAKNVKVKPTDDSTLVVDVFRSR